MMKWNTMTRDWSMKLKVCVYFVCFGVFRLFLFSFFFMFLCFLALFYCHSTLWYKHCDFTKDKLKLDL